MSSSIWTRCAGASSVGALRVDPWRAVEGQHVISTRKLVDTDDEQRVLEELLEGSKPSLRPDESELHYLLFTPFRYPPLRWGSRFGTRAERGIFYGSRKPRTCFAEIAYYRLLFLEGTAADLGPLLVELTLFRSRVHTLLGVDLTRPPFADHVHALASRSSYAETQALGRAMRQAGVHAFLFASARDPAAGANVGVLSPAAFAAPRPTEVQRWLCAAARDAVELRRLDPLKDPDTVRFERAAFTVDGRLPVVGSD